jgi:hypothetical protein
MSREMTRDVAFLCLIAWFSCASQTAEKRDYIFLIDESASMVGQGTGSVNIMPKVRVALLEYVRQIPLQSRILVMPFSDGIKNRFEITLESSQEVERLQEYMMSIDPKGQRTFVYRAIDEALKQARLMKGADELKFQQVLLFTDGRDNDPEGRTMQDQMDLFSQMHRDNKRLFLFYYTLGVDLPEEDRSVLQNTDGVKFNEVQKGEAPVMQKTEPDFSASATSGDGTLAVQFIDKTVGPVLEWNWQFGDGTSSSEQNPKHQYGIGEYTVTLVITAPTGPVSSRKDNLIKVASPPIPTPIWQKALWGLGGLALILALAFGVFCLREGTGPVDGIEALGAKLSPRLEGELEVLEPEERNGETVKLKGKKSISVGLKGEFLPELDAGFRLEVSVMRGKKGVKMISDENSIVKLNGDDVYAHAIYDASIIELGTKERVKIRYNNADLQEPMT